MLIFYVQYVPQIDGVWTTGNISIRGFINLFFHWGFGAMCSTFCIFAASISKSNSLGIWSYFEPNSSSIWSYFEPNSLSIRSQNGCGFWRPFFVRITESHTIVKRIPKWPLKIIIYFGLQSGSMNWFTWWYFRQSYGTRLHWLLAGVCSWWRASVPRSQDISIKGRKKLG